jgi:hypothetical protein
MTHMMTNSRFNDKRIETIACVPLNMFGMNSPVSHKRDPSHTRMLPRSVPLTLRNIFVDFCPDVTSGAQLREEVVAVRKPVYRPQNTVGKTMQLKLAALAALILLCLICAGCPDESQQELSRNTHPRSVAVAEYGSASTELVCAGAAILAAFLWKRKEAGR